MRSLPEQLQLLLMQMNQSLQEMMLQMCLLEQRMSGPESSIQQLAAQRRHFKSIRLSGAIEPG